MCTGRGTQLKGKRFVSWPQRTPVIKRIRPGNRARILCFFSPPLALSLSFSLFLPLIYPPLSTPFSHPRSFPSCFTSSSASYRSSPRTAARVASLKRSRIDEGLSRHDNILFCSTSRTGHPAALVLVFHPRFKRRDVFMSSRCHLPYD